MTVQQTAADARPVLLGSVASPFVRKVRIALAEKRIAYEWSRAYYGCLSEANPLAKVPVLVTSDGERIFDSRVICEYLDLIQPEPRLLPEAPAARLEVKRWEALADGICDAVVAVVNERTRELPAEASRPWFEHQQGKAERAIAWAARAMGDKPWCCGSGLTLADAALFSALRYASFRLPAVQWEQAHPNLQRYCEALEHREAFASTSPKAQQS